MNDVERRALELVSEVREEGGSTHEAPCRAIEAHDAYRQEVSEAVKRVADELSGMAVLGDIMLHLSRFIIQPKTDPLVEVVKALQDGRSGSDPKSYAACLRNELKSRGLEIRQVGE